MTSFKTDKAVKEILAKTQKMFPNCGKYKQCCVKDKDFWDKMKDQPKVKVPSSEIPIQEESHEQILHNVNGFKIDKKRDKIPKKPEGFEGW